MCYEYLHVVDAPIPGTTRVPGTMVPILGVPGTYQVPGTLMNCYSTRVLSTPHWLFECPAKGTTVEVLYHTKNNNPCACKIQVHCGKVSESHEKCSTIELFLLWDWLTIVQVAQLLWKTSIVFYVTMSYVLSIVPRAVCHTSSIVFPYCCIIARELVSTPSTSTVGWELGSTRNERSLHFFVHTTSLLSPSIP